MNEVYVLVLDGSLFGVFSNKEEAIKGLTEFFEESYHFNYQNYTEDEINNFINVLIDNHYCEVNNFDIYLTPMKVNEVIY